MADTLQEKESRPEAARVRLFTFVLRFSQLLPAHSRCFRLDEARVVVGRGEQLGQPSRARLEVDDKHASQDHLVLERRGQVTIAVDGGSKNGTFLNGQRLETEATLADGDLLQLGHGLWCYREVEAKRAPPAEGVALSGGERTFNPELAELHRQLGLIAVSKEPVLVIAETGSGKELVSRAVHRLSARKGPLVAVDCGAVPDTLFESTLFGHEKGAFTGAAEARVGEVQRADRGTLFLDELGNLPPTAQAKLLRALETGQVQALGGKGPQQVDVRWVAATNAELFDEPTVRSDLLHRLAGFVARLPPLRRRREDLGVLCAAFLAELGFTHASISPGAGRALFSHPFPGNVRQLRSALRSAALLAGGDAKTPSQVELDTPHFPELAREAAGAAPAEREKPKRSTAPTEAELIAVLVQTDGNVSKAAKLLGTYPRQLYRWLEEQPQVLEKFRG